MGWVWGGGTHCEGEALKDRNHHRETSQPIAERRSTLARRVEHRVDPDALPLARGGAETLHETHAAAGRQPLDRKVCVGKRCQ